MLTLESNANENADRKCEYIDDSNDYRLCVINGNRSRSIAVVGEVEE